MTPSDWWEDSGAEYRVFGGNEEYAGLYCSEEAARSKGYLVLMYLFEILNGVW